MKTRFYLTVENTQLEEFSESKGDMTTKSCVRSSGKKKASGIFNSFIINLIGNIISEINSFVFHI